MPKFGGQCSLAFRQGIGFFRQSCLSCQTARAIPTCHRTFFPHFQFQCARIVQGSTCTSIYLQNKRGQSISKVQMQRSKHQPGERESCLRSPSQTWLLHVPLPAAHAPLLSHAVKRVPMQCTINRTQMHKHVKQQMQHHTRQTICMFCRRKICFAVGRYEKTTNATSHWTNNLHALPSSNQCALWHKKVTHTHTDMHTDIHTS